MSDEVKKSINENLEGNKSESSVFIPDNLNDTNMSPFFEKGEQRVLDPSVNTAKYSFIAADESGKRYNNSNEKDREAIRKMLENELQKENPNMEIVHLLRKDLERLDKSSQDVHNNNLKHQGQLVSLFVGFFALALTAGVKYIKK